MESLSLTTTVMGVLSLHEQADSSLYSTLFLVMIYCDFLLGLWGLIPDVNRRKYVRYGMLLLPLSLYSFPQASDMIPLLLIAGCLLSVLIFRVFYSVRYAFSISEVILFSKWILLFVFLLFTSPSLSLRVSIVVLLLSLLLTFVVLFLCDRYSRIKQSPLALYSLIVAGAAIEIAALSQLVDSAFVPWFLRWLLQTTEAFTPLSWSRPLTLLYWFSVLGAMGWCLARGLLSRQPQIIQRKFFHLVAVALFLPGLTTDVPFMQSLLASCLTRRVAFAFAFLVFLLLEIFRITAVPPFAGLDDAMSVFVDSRDAGPFILTHFSLLLSCAIPAWIAPEPHNPIDLLACLSGVLSVGVGDASVGTGEAFQSRLRRWAPCGVVFRSTARRRWRGSWASLPACWEWSLSSCVDH